MSEHILVAGTFKQSLLQTSQEDGTGPGSGVRVKECLLFLYTELFGLLYSIETEGDECKVVVECILAL